LARVSSVGIDKELNVRPNRLACGAHAILILLGMRAYFHLHHANALRSPTAELALELRDAVGGESPASVNGNAIAALAQQHHERKAKQLRFQVPERGVNRGDRHRCDSRTAEVTNLPQHDAPAFADREGVLAFEQLGKWFVNQGCYGLISVGVS